MSYLIQGWYPLHEAVSAIVIAEKDKRVRVYGTRGPLALSWGLWEVPDADNDSYFEDGPQTA